jgi:hypothetical protein
MRSMPNFSWKSKPELGRQLDITHPLSQGLQAMWLFNENQGNNTTDLVTHRIATLEEGSVSWENGSLSISQANSGCLSAPAIPIMHKFTVESLIYPLTTTQIGAGNGTPAIYSDYFNGNSLNCVLGYNEYGNSQTGTSNLFVGYYDASSGWHTAYAGAGLTPGGIWSHVVGTYDGANINLYINGNKVANTASTVTPSKLATNISRIGRRWDRNDYFTGDIAKLSLYNYAMSQDQIGMLYSDVYQMILPPSTRRMYAFFGGLKPGILH